MTWLDLIRLCQLTVKVVTAGRRGGENIHVHPSSIFVLKIKPLLHNVGWRLLRAVHEVVRHGSAAPRDKMSRRRSAAVRLLHPGPTTRPAPHLQPPRLSVITAAGHGQNRCGPPSRRRTPPTPSTSRYRIDPAFIHWQIWRPSLPPSFGRRPTFTANFLSYIIILVERYKMELRRGRWILEILGSPPNPTI